MDEKRAKEVFSDEAFVKQLMEKETAEEVQAALQEKGLEISLEDLEKFRDRIIKVNSQNGALSTEDLDDVAGGLMVFIPIPDKGEEAVEKIKNSRW